MMDVNRPRAFVYDLILVAGALILLSVGIYYMRIPRIGVLDANLVAKELGVDAKIARDDARGVNETAVRLDELRERFREVAEPLSAKLDKATDEREKARIKDEILKARSAYQGKAELIGREYQLHRDNVRRTFRRRLDPVIRKVARARRLDVVIDRGAAGGVLYANARADITDEVLKGARAVITADMPLIDTAASAATAATDVMSPGAGEIDEPLRDAGASRTGGKASR